MLRKKAVLVLICLCLVGMLISCGSTDPDEEFPNNIKILDDNSTGGSYSYTVTFDSVGGSAVASQTTEADEDGNMKTNKPRTPTKENYTFDGWYSDSLYSKEWDFDADIFYADTTLYARWTLDGQLTNNAFYVKLLFDCQKTSSEITINVSAQTDSFSFTDKILVQDKSGAEGLYALYRDENCSNIVGNVNKVTVTDLRQGNNVFYLQVGTPSLSETKVYTVNIYRAYYYTVSFFDKNEQLYYTATVEEGSSVAAPKYVTNGYTLIRWAEPYGTVSVTPNGKVTATRDISLYAECEPAEYTVSFSTDGGSSVSPVTVRYDEEFRFPTTQKSGSLFVGWYTADGTKLTGSNGVGMIHWFGDENATVYARWETVVFTVSYTDKVDGASDGNGDYSVEESGSIAIEPLDHPKEITSEGTKFYVFDGWYNSFGVKIGKYPKHTLTDVRDDMSLEARWSVLTVKTVCNEEHGCCASGNDTEFSVVAKEEPLINGVKNTLTVTCAENQPYHSFATDDVNNTSFTLSAANNVEYVFTEMTADTLLCYWTEYSLIVRHMIREGSENRFVTPDETLGGLNTAETVTPYAPGTAIEYTLPDKDEGYTLFYMLVEADSGEERISDRSYSGIMPKGDLVITPVWLARTVTVATDVHGTTVTDWQNDTVGSSFSVAAYPNDGYYYSGLTYKDGTAYSEYILPSSATELIPQFKALPIEVKCNIGGAGCVRYSINSHEYVGTETGGSFVMKGVCYTDTLVLSASTYNGYFWLGWYVEKDGVSSLLTADRDAEIKVGHLSDEKTVYRASWKKIGVEAKVTSVNTDKTMTVGGTVSCSSYFDENGIQKLCLDTVVTAGYLFEGWFATELSYDEDGGIRQSGGTEPFSYDRTCVLNWADCAEKYDMSSFVAKFSQISLTTTSTLSLAVADAEAQGGYKRVASDTVAVTVAGVPRTAGSVSMIAYYELRDGKAVQMTEITAKTNRITVVDEDSVGFNYLGLFRTENQNDNSAIKPGSGSLWTVTVDEENSSVTYVAPSANILADEYNYGPFIAKWAGLKIIDTEKISYAQGVSLSSLIDVGTGGKVEFFGLHGSYYLKAVPEYGQIFDSWELTTLNDKKQIETDTKYGTLLSMTAVNAVAAKWSTLNAGNTKIYLRTDNTFADNDNQISVWGENVKEIGQKNIYVRVYFSAPVYTGYVFCGWYQKDAALVASSEYAVNDYSQMNLISGDNEFSVLCTSLEDYFGKGTIYYYAVWKKMTARIVTEQVTAYSVRGYATDGSGTKYVVEPDLPSFTVDGHYYYDTGDRLFLGWYRGDTRYSVTDAETDFRLETDQAIADTLTARWETYVNPISFDYYTSGGTVHASLFRTEDGTVRLMMWAEPKYGYRFEGWYEDSAHLVVWTDGVASIESTLGARCITLDNQTAQKTLYPYFLTMGSDENQKVSMESVVIESGASGISESDVGTFGYYAYKSGTQYTVFFRAELNSGFSFNGWDITDTDMTLETGTRLNTVFSIEAFDFAVNTVTVRPRVSVIQTNSVSTVNQSTVAGTVTYDGLWDADSNKYLMFTFTPNPGYAFWKIVEKRTGVSEQKTYPTETAQTTIAGNNATLILPYNEVGIYTYTVYWKSIWNTTSTYITLLEELDEITVVTTGYLKHYRYASGIERNEERLCVQSLFGAIDGLDEEYEVIGWYIKEIVDEETGDTVDRYVQHTANLYVATEAEDKEYFCLWGKYSVTVENVSEGATEGVESTSSTERYNAVVTFNNNLPTETSFTYVTDVRFMYGESAEAIRALIASDAAYKDYRQYTLSDFDLNGGEGGQCIVMLWKKSGQSTQAIREIGLSETRLTEAETAAGWKEALFLNDRTVADLNYSVSGGTPLYFRYSLVSAFSKGLTQIGLEINGENEVFSGTYAYCDGEDKRNITSKGTVKTYLVYDTVHTGSAIKLNNTVEKQNISLIRSLTYPMDYADRTITPSGMIFAGWYDNEYCNGTPYDFTAPVYGTELSLYAKWYNTADYNASESNILPIGFGAEKTVSATNTSVFYFAALSSADYQFSFRTIDNIPLSYVKIYDKTANRLILDTYFDNKQKWTVSVPTVAGNLYSVVISEDDPSATGRITLSTYAPNPTDRGGVCALIPYNQTFSVTAIPSFGQSFVGWYDGNGKQIGVETEKRVDPENYDKKSDETYLYYDKVLTVPYANLSGDLHLTAKYYAYVFYIINSDSDAGTASVNASSNYQIGNTIELTATANNGFRFKSWDIYYPDTGVTKSVPSTYIDNIEYLSGSSEYKFTATNKDLILIAVWETYGLNARTNTYTITYELSSDISSLGVELGESDPINNPNNRTSFYRTDEEFADESSANTTRLIQLYDPTWEIERNGAEAHYIFNGWYLDEEFTEQITFLNPADASQLADKHLTITLYAKWSKAVPTVTVQTDENGKRYIELGEYPQTLVTDESEIMNIGKTVGSDGYYHSSEQIDGKDRKYIKETVNEQTVYFRVEPIRWNVLSVSGTQYTVVCDRILFADCFNVSSSATEGETLIYPNNWESSSIRDYLNGEFLNTYFNAFEQNLLAMTVSTVKNDSLQGKVDTRNEKTYPWITQNDTEDTLYLMSYREITDNSVGYSLYADTKDAERQVEVTEYVRLTSDVVGEDGEYVYLLRTPGSTSRSILCVNRDGQIIEVSSVTRQNFGILPCTVIDIGN